MTVEIDGKMISKITNVMGWIDSVPKEIQEVAFCVTDFGRSNVLVIQPIFTFDTDRKFKTFWMMEITKKCDCNHLPIKTNSIEFLAILQESRYR